MTAPAKKMTNGLALLLATLTGVVTAMGADGAERSAAASGSLIPWLIAAGTIAIAALLSLFLFLNQSRRKRLELDLAKISGEVAILEEAVAASDTVCGIVDNVPEAVLFRFYAGTSGTRDAWFVSETAEQIVGVSAAPLADFLPRLTAAVGPECRGNFQSSMETAITKKTAWLFEGRVLDSAGHERWFRCAARPGPAEDGTALDGAFWDITNFKRAERAAKEREEQNRLPFNSSLDAMFLTHHGGLIAAANPAACAMFERAEQDLVKEKILSLADPADLRMHAALAECARSGHFQGEMTFRRKDRSLFPAQLSLHASPGATGEEQLCVVIRDISEPKQLAQELVVAQNAAKSTRQAKAEFLANMSHELRTPLNGVLGVLQLLENTTLDEEQKQYIVSAKSAGWSQLTLIGDILNLADIEAGKLVLREEEVALRPLLSTVREALLDRAQEKGLEFTCDALPTLAESARIDAAQLQGIMLSLAGNAIKFTERGAVSVSLDSRPGPAPGRIRLILTVADSGIGMSAEMKGKLFTPFSRQEDTYRCGHQGAGLGLSIVKQLVDRMGGSIRIESTEGSGTTATVEFEVPLAKPSPVLEPVIDAGTEKAHAIRPPRPLRVLVVEDNEINRFVLCHFLEKSGHTVTTAVDGYEAIIRFRSSTFDLILMDIQLPCMDGLEATRMIRSDPRGARVPIVAVTSYAMGTDQKTFLAAGMTECLVKPLDMKLLSNLLTRVIKNTFPATATEGKTP